MDCDLPQMLVSVIPCNHQPTGVVISTPQSNWNPHFVRSSCTRKIPGVSGKFSHPVLGFHMTKQWSKITTSCHQSSQKKTRKVIKTQRFYAREIYEIPAMFSPPGDQPRVRFRRVAPCFPCRDGARRQSSSAFRLLGSTSNRGDDKWLVSTGELGIFLLEMLEDFDGKAWNFLGKVW